MIDISKPETSFTWGGGGICQNNGKLTVKVMFQLLHSASLYS